MLNYQRVPVGQPSTNQPTNGKRTSMFQHSTALCITITVWTSVSHAPKIPHLPNPPRLHYEVQRRWKYMEITVLSRVDDPKMWTLTLALSKKNPISTPAVKPRYPSDTSSPWSSPTRNCEMILAALLVKPMRPWAAASGEFVMQKKLGPKQLC